MTSHPLWTRRNFIATTGLAVSAAASPLRLAALPLRLAFTIAACASGIRIQSLHSPRASWHLPTPQQLTLLGLHPTLPTLYVASPATSTSAATISSFSIHLADAATPLHPQTTQPLSLATRSPRALTVTADLRHLLTLDHRGQINLHPLDDATGAILPLEHVRQLTGAAPDRPSRPSALLAHRHLVYIADPGAHRLALLSTAGSEPTLLPSLDLPATVSPDSLSLHPEGQHLVISSLTSPTTAARLPLHPETLLPHPAGFTLHPLRRSRPERPLVFPPETATA